MHSTIVRSTACLGTTLAVISACIPLRGAQAVQGQAETIEADEHAITEQQIFAELVDHNQVRSDALLAYIATRTYRVSQPTGKVYAEIDGRMEFQAPNTKRFVVLSEQGSGIIRRLALHPLIASELDAAAGKDRHDSAIAPANYTLKVIGEETVGTYRCYVLRAIPKRVDKYLFDGKLWVDQQDFAVVRIEGRPAARLSFWIKRAEFVRQYQKVDGFWLPQRDETVVDVRIYGKKLLTIDHRDYAVTGVRSAASRYQRSGAFLP